MGLGEDYEFLPSEGESDEEEKEEEEDLKDHVEKMRIEEASKMNEDNKGEGEGAKVQ